MTLAYAVIAFNMAASPTVFRKSTATHKKLREFRWTIILVLRQMEMELYGMKIILTTLEYMGEVKSIYLIGNWILKMGYVQEELFLPL